MNKQRIAILGSFVLITGIVVLYVFLGATQFAQNSTDTQFSEAPELDNFIPISSTLDLLGRDTVSQIDTTFVARDSANIQAITVIDENHKIFLERDSKKVYSLIFREYFNETLLYDLSPQISGNIQFAILPRRDYNEYIFLKVDGKFWMYKVKTQQLAPLSETTTFISYNELSRTLYAVEQGETANAKVTSYEITGQGLRGVSFNKKELFTYPNIEKVYTSFDSVFVSTSQGLYRYFGSRLFQVFKSTATPRVSFAPLTNFAIVNNESGNSFLYEFTDEEDVLIDLGESFVPSRVLWGSNRNFFEIQTGLLREFVYGELLTMEGTITSREWILNEEMVIEPFVYDIDSQDGIYFIDSAQNMLRYVSRNERFK
jgi:hypothetical protein